MTGRFLISRTGFPTRYFPCWYFPDNVEVKGHAVVNIGQAEVKLLRNALWLPNLVGRISNQSIMHCWDQRSCRDQPEVKLLRNALRLPNLVGRGRTPDQSGKHCWSQGHAEVRQGQPGIKLPRNALWLPNLVGRNPDQRIMHCWNQRSCWGQPESTRGQIARKSPMATKFGNGDL